jgi:hypothetical protein
MTKLFSADDQLFFPPEAVSANFSIGKIEKKNFEEI